MSDVERPAASAEPWRLDQFLKVQGVVGTGGEAKMIIQDGLVKVNGVVETRRRRKLQTGDQIEFQDTTWSVP